MNATINHNGDTEAETQPLERGRPVFPDFPGDHSHPAPPRITSREEPSLNPAQSPPGRRRPGRKLLFAILVALVIVGSLLWQRSGTYRQLAITTSQMAVPTVSTALPQAAPADVEIKLPGNLMAYSEASIYARTNGYLKAWYTDIGAKVATGQLIAEIDAPDVDAQLRQATADLSRARATLDIDQLNFQRSKQLLATLVVSQQDFDQNRTTLEAQQAAVRADEASVQDLTVQQGFEKIIAPFNGVVTRRNTDIGALINAGSSAASTAQELFHLARTDILRVYISVPEIYSPLVRVDTPAWLGLAEYPGVKFQGKVADVAGAIDPASRTLLTEVQVPNHDGRLFPGAYADVHLVLKLKNPPTVIPINTLIFRSQGTQVGVVDNSNIVHLKHVTIGRDFGTSLEITSGIENIDRLILNPSDSLADGTKVHVQL
ncbi:MAG: efflux RND transporter periplasmic adaptor subunit [Chthoniobacteraceae bacterium]|jgi:RND family efflux transporter MFP subunit